MALMPVVKVVHGNSWPKPPHPLTLMVSNSKDGEFTNRACGMMGLHIIRGSAPTQGKGKTEGKRGFEAAREAMQVMSKGAGLMLTIDGPKGPPEEVSVGAVKLAQQMGAPILCLGLSAAGKRLNTWDRLLFPGLFARGALVVAPPIPTSKAMGTDELRKQVERTLKDVTARADMLAGQTDTALPPKKIAALSAAPAASAPDGALEHGGS
jgi:lysophospholipid acyltransferase (LPLAT)-like uncharacterized protein